MDDYIEELLEENQLLNDDDLNECWRDDLSEREYRFTSERLQDI